MSAETTRTTPAYVPHIGESRQYWRDIILGVNDGLVSTFLLVAGVTGGGLGTTAVLLTAIAGSIAGSISMGAGEFLATETQEEVFDREVEIEKQHIEHHRQQEVDQLYDYFRAMEIDEEDIETAVAIFAKKDATILETMKRLEFGLVDEERRSPTTAMLASGGLFLLGSLTSVVPFFFVESAETGLILAAVVTALGLFAVGAGKTRVTGTNPIGAGLKNLLIAGIGGVVAFVIGSLVQGMIG